MSVNDDFGDRMKMYERFETDRRMMPQLPILIRLDGKGFSRWTKGLQRPFDSRMSETMIEVTKKLVQELNARIGYTQSDEISLVFLSETEKGETFCDGKIQKLTSIISSMATAWFNRIAAVNIPEKKDQIAFFDCRVWNVPTKTEASNAILWRERDASKNSVSMSAREFFSFKELQNKSCNEMQNMMLLLRNVNWNDYPSFFKRGTFVQKKNLFRVFSKEELKNLPEKHVLRIDSEAVIERSEIRLLEMPPFGKVTNRVEVIFNGDEPSEGE